MRISIVIPAHNESASIPKLLQDIRAFMDDMRWEYEVLVIDDGSTDDTLEIANAFADRMPVRVIRHHENEGYGAALRTGFDASTQDWIFITDGDRQFDIKELALFASHSEEADLIIGYRKHRKDHWGRLLNAWVFNKTVQLLFGLKVHDIDCAFKLIRRSVVRELTLESKGAFISTELLLRAKQRGRRIIQIPVSHLPRLAGTPTGARVDVILRAMKDLILFRLTGHV